MLRVAAVQMQVEPIDPSENFRRIESWMPRAATAQASLIVFPECVLTGYFLTRQEAEEMAEPVSGPRVQSLQALCARWGMTAAVGTIERSQEGQLFNAAVLVGPQGLLAVYRKTHLLCLGVDRYLTPGSKAPAVVATDMARLGMLICYDLRFPEPMRALALDGAQAILLPTAWPASATFYPDFLARTRALENGVYLIAANRAGQERGQSFLGRSLILGPQGEILAESHGHEETMLVADIDPAQSDAKHRVFDPGEYEVDLLRDRRPELYGRLTESKERQGRLAGRPANEES
ncbi:MAG TPA: carbon-nitrogen hydrolase family protein [Anaerolineales bacterium]|nr:carbon-nitrogen hydrolase family protein [Anaerolineales bacterium]